MLVLLTTAMVTLTGCLDIVEDLLIREDGSGTYSLTMDFNRLMSDPFMREMMLSSLVEEGTFSAEEMEMDTTMYFESMPVPPEGVYANIWKEANMYVRMSETDSKLMSRIIIPFKQISDIAYAMDMLGADEEAGSMLSGGGVFSETGFDFRLDGNKLERNRFRMSDEIMSEEEADFLKMFLADATFTTNYHFPGKVKSADIEGALVEGSEVTVTHSLLDLMEGSHSNGGSIQFRN